MNNIRWQNCHRLFILDTIQTEKYAAKTQIDFIPYSMILIENCIALQLPTENKKTDQLKNIA